MLTFTNEQDDVSTMRIVVTGSAGQVGHALLMQDWGALVGGDPIDVIGMTRENLDVTDPLATRERLQTLNPDWVINASAYTAVDTAETDSVSAYAVNCEAPECLASVCHSIGAKFVHISTDYVYSGQGSVPVSEIQAIGPTSVYGASKLAGELLVARACKEHIVLRTAWVFSATGNNFVKTMLRLGTDRKQIGVVNDQWGGPTSAAGIANAIGSIIRSVYETESSGGSANHLWGTYNFSGEPYVNWMQFAETIFNQAQSKGVLKSVPQVQPITTEEYVTAARRPSNSRLSNDKIKRAFGLPPDNWKRALGDVLDQLMAQGLVK